MKPGEEEKLKKIVERLSEKYRIYAAILFGSRARGDWGPWSDYDLLIIADFEKPYLQRTAEISKELVDIDIPVEVHPYTLKEAEEMLKKANPLIVDALEEGIILKSANELNHLKKLLERLKEKGLKRTETSIVLP